MEGLRLAKRLLPRGSKLHFRGYFRVFVLGFSLFSFSLSLSFDQAKQIVYSDSQLVLNQVFGKWKINNAGLLTLQKQCRHELMGLHVLSFEHVARARNSAADRLCNTALDETAAPGHVETTANAGALAAIKPAPAEPVSEAPAKVRKLSLALQPTPWELAVVKLSALCPVSWETLGPLLRRCPFSSVTCTGGELSLVLPEAMVGAVILGATAQVESNWGAVVVSPLLEAGE